jgi:hypothetical protein
MAMRRWGIVITVFYTSIVIVLLFPGAFWLIEKNPGVANILSEALHYYRHWFPLLCVGILVGGQALLMFLSVDTSWRRLKPRQHIAVTASLAGLFTSLLTYAAIMSLAVILGGNDVLFKEGLFLSVFGGDSEIMWYVKGLGLCIALWIVWGVVFYLYYRGSSEVVSKAVTWLLKGSVFELLIAIPAHVIVRQRGDCSAPVATGFGIVTGIAIMLLCFGPGVLALYKKRLDAYAWKRERSG